MTKEEKLKLFYDNQLYCITAEEYSLGRTNIEVVSEILEAGVKIVQYREKKKKGLYRYEECLEIRKLTRKYDAILIVNDFVDLAMMVGADGIHLGHEDYPISEVRKIVGQEMIIGGSTHWPEQMKEMIDSGVDYIAAGPVFETHTKEDVIPPVGIEYLEYALKTSPVPVVAIGGIKEHNFLDVVGVGAKCVCMVTEIVGAPSIKEKIEKIYSLWNSHKAGL